MPEYFCRQCRKNFSTGSDEPDGAQNPDPVVCPFCHTVCSGGNTVMETLLAPGTDFCSYRIIRHLGFEQHAVSRYLAEQLSIGRKAELKIMDTAVADQEEIETFQEEAKISVRFSHPNIVSAMEAGSFEQFRYIAMQHVEGYSIAAHLKNGHLFTPEEAIRCILPAAGALKTVWNKQKLFHGYLTPSCIVISEDKDPFILNFETAGIYGENPFAVNELDLISASFFSPEQAQFRELSRETDQYSLGAILYNMTCGKLPYLAESAAELKKKIIAGPFPKPVKPSGEAMPQDFVNLIRRMTASDPKDRFESWEAFIEEARGVEITLRMKPVKAAVPAAAPAAEPAAAQVPADTQTTVTREVHENTEGSPSGKRKRFGWIIGFSVLLLFAVLFFWYYQKVKLECQQILTDLKVVELHCSGMKYQPDAARIIRSAEDRAKQKNLSLFLFTTFRQLKKEEPLKSRIGGEEQKRFEELAGKIRLFKKQCGRDLSFRGIELKTAGTGFVIHEKAGRKDNDFSSVFDPMQKISKQLEETSFSFQDFKEKTGDLKKDFAKFQNNVRKAVNEYNIRQAELSGREQKRFSELAARELTFRKQCCRTLAEKGILFKNGQSDPEKYEIRLTNGQKKNDFSSLLASLQDFRNKMETCSFSSPDTRQKMDSLMKRFLVFQSAVKKAVGEYEKQYEENRKKSQRKSSPADMVKILKPLPKKTEKPETRKPAIRKQEAKKQEPKKQAPQKQDAKKYQPEYQMDNSIRNGLRNTVLLFLKVPLNSHSRMENVNGVQVLSVYKNIFRLKLPRELEENKQVRNLKNFTRKISGIQVKAEAMYAAVENSGEKFRECKIYYRKKENKIWRIKKGSVTLYPSGAHVSLKELGRYNLQQLCSYAAEHDEKLRTYQFAFLVKIHAYDAAAKVAASGQDQEFLSVLKANYPAMAYLPELHQSLLDDKTNLPNSLFTHKQKQELKRMERNKYLSENQRKRSLPKYLQSNQKRVYRTQNNQQTYKKGSKK